MLDLGMGVVIVRVKLVYFLKIGCIRGRLLSTVFRLLTWLRGIVLYSHHIVVSFCVSLVNVSVRWGSATATGRSRSCCLLRLMVISVFFAWRLSSLCRRSGTWLALKIWLTSRNQEGLNVHSIAIVVWTPETVSAKIAFGLIRALSHSCVWSGGSTLMGSFVVHRLPFAWAGQEIFNFFVQVF